MKKMWVKIQVALCRSGSSGTVRLEQCEGGPAGGEGRGDIRALARCGTTGPSVSVSLMFWLTLDETGHGVGLFPSANESAQVRLRAQQSAATGRHSDWRKLLMQM